MLTHTSVCSALLFVVLSIACGGASTPVDDPFTGAPERTVVVGDGKRAVFVTPSGSDCVQIGTQCVRPQDKCGPGARADVIVDSKGKVLEIVCYPPAPSAPPVESTGDIDLGKDNKATVTLDGQADGADIAGDVRSRGNNVTIYGQGPGVSLIGGSVVADGNNFSMRGVTVQRNVTVKGNNATLVLCVIEGDLLIEGNNAVMAECTVLGKVTIKGNNAVLVANRIAGGLSVDGKEAVCDGNLQFTDGNANRVADPGELGVPLACSNKK